jgi:hypothetical protein
MEDFTVGEKVYSRYKSVYYKAEITKISGGKYSVKYPGWGSKWDEVKEKKDLLKFNAQNKKIVDESMRKAKELEKKSSSRRKGQVEGCYKNILFILFFFFS